MHRTFMLVGQGDGNLWLFIASPTWGDFLPTVIGDPYGYLAAFTIPIVLIIVGAVGQKLVEAVPFEWRHFYLGVDLTLSALSAALINVLDLFGTEKQLMKATVVTTVLFIVACIFSFVVQLAFHQEW